MVWIRLARPNHVKSWHHASGSAWCHLAPRRMPWSKEAPFWHPPNGTIAQKSWSEGILQQRRLRNALRWSPFLVPRGLPPRLLGSRALGAGLLGGRCLQCCPQPGCRVVSAEQPLRHADCHFLLPGLCPSSDRDRIIVDGILAHAKLRFQQICIWRRGCRMHSKAAADPHGLHCEGVFVLSKGVHVEERIAIFKAVPARR
mmetsp:Transcript_2256/g.4651  ORF Transcript_2256/g.4651 Transcript_2256/m.4651 type:complete len:200 (-) Transcript_2256:274-873(-)